MHSLRDALASHGWLLYATVFGLIFLGMPACILVGGVPAWLIMFGAHNIRRSAGTTWTCEPAARSASRLELLVATAVICAAVSYVSVVQEPIKAETARIVMDSLLQPLRKWSCSTQGRDPNIIPLMFVSQCIGAFVSQVPNVILLAPLGAWFGYAKKKTFMKTGSNVIFSDGDQDKMCVAIAVTTCFLVTVPPLPCYRGGAYGSRLDQPRVGWMQYGLMRELKLT